MTGLFHKSKGNILIPMISAWLARCGIRNGTLVFLWQCPPYLFQELLPEYVSAIQSLRQLLFEPQSRFSSAFHWCFHFVHGNKVRTFCFPSMLRALCNNVIKWGFHFLYPRISKNHISKYMKNTKCRNSTLQLSAFSHFWFPSPVLNGTVPAWGSLNFKVPGHCRPPVLLPSCECMWTLCRKITSAYLWCGAPGMVWWWRGWIWLDGSQYIPRFFF